MTKGLKPGDRIITQGLADLKPNAPIKPVPANAAQRVAPPSPEEMKKMQAQGKGGGAG
ncbi:hypothetical protein AB5I41_01805 [Sphingomonas sp. MMS24-JH45]